MYCITLRNKFDKTIIGWYDASASNFSTDQRRAKLFSGRVAADLIADQLRRMYPRLAQDIEVTPVQPTALIDSSDRCSRVAMIHPRYPDYRCASISFWGDRAIAGQVVRPVSAEFRFGADLQTPTVIRSRAEPKVRIRVPPAGSLLPT